jgi:ABC-2 type transport system ATP-binding protein
MDHGKVIALGTPNELIASIGGEEIVEFELVSAPGNLTETDHQSVAAALAAITGVRSHRVDASVHQLSVDELHVTVPLIFASLEKQGLHLNDFRTHSATLEDVFVRLTGRNLRDE